LRDHRHQGRRTGLPSRRLTSTGGTQGEDIMPFVNIRIVKEVIAADPAGKKADIAKKVTEAIMDATGLTNNDVWVVFEEVNARDWYVGKTDVETLRKG
jgi:4-oxalocrotonate tautomerase